MKRCSFAVVAVLFSNLAAGQTTTPAPTWTDACNYPTPIPTEQQDNVDRLLEAEAVLINRGDLTPYANQFFVNNPVAFTEYYVPHEAPQPPDIYPLCSDSVFYNEFQMAQNGNGRTGFLVAPDMVVTAPHSSSFNPADYYVVFGWNRGARGSTCTTGGMNQFIPNNDVYEITSSNDFVYVLGSYADFMAFRINTAGHTPRRYLRLRTSGTASTDDEIAIAGHPFLMPTKFQYGVSFVGLSGTTYSDVDPLAPLFSGFYLDLGNSGSPVYNVTKGVVEEVIRGPHDPLDKGVSLDTYGSCNASFYSGGGRTLADDFDGLHATPHPDILNVGPVQTLEAQIRPSLPQSRIDPLQDTTYVLPVGGTATPASSTYTFSAPHVGGTTYVSASLAATPAGEPDLLTAGAGVPYFGGLSTDQSVSFTVNAYVPSNAVCGTYDRFLEIGAGDYLDRIRHRFEIGLKEEKVEPEDDWVVHDLGAPYAQSRVYTLRNVRPTATHVMVSRDTTLPDSTMILINGLTSSFGVDLGPQGSPTDTATFTLTIDSTIANSKPMDVDVQGRVAIYNQPFNCSATGYIYRNVTFRRGEQKFVSPQPLTLMPKPVGGNTFGTPVRFDVDLSNDGAFCTSDLNVDVGFYSIGAIGRDTAPQYVKIQVTSPSGRTGVIWDRQANPGGNNYDVNEVVDGFTGISQLFHLDDALSPPLGPQMLSYWNGARLKGHWYIDVSTSTTNDMVVGPVRIDLHRSALCNGGGL
jgi:hypothetical protein